VAKPWCRLFFIFPKSTGLSDIHNFLLSKYYSTLLFEKQEIFKAPQRFLSAAGGEISMNHRIAEVFSD